MPKISVQNVCKSFGSNQVLKGISLDVEEGESLVIIGGSGSGKSVLLKCILGLMHPDSGSIMIDGRETVKLRGKEHDKLMLEFGMLFQGGALFDSLYVWENICFSKLQRKEISRNEAKKRAVELLDEVGLRPEVANLHPAELSGGMQKRVALARAIAGDPQIIFFDEPTTGLDPIMADVINELIVSCVKQRGLTTVTITHDMMSARKIADRVAMLYKGEIIWHGPVKEIDTTDNAYVDQFIHGKAEGPITAERVVATV